MSEKTNLTLLLDLFWERFVELNSGKFKDSFFVLLASLNLNTVSLLYLDCNF